MNDTRAIEIIKAHAGPAILGDDRPLRSPDLAGQVMTAIDHLTAPDRTAAAAKLGLLFAELLVQRMKFDLAAMKATSAAMHSTRRPLS